MKSASKAIQSNDNDASYKGPREVVVLDEERGSIPFDRLVSTDLGIIAQGWLDMPRLPDETLPRWGEFRLSAYVKMIDKLCVLLAHDGDADRMEVTVCGQHATDYIGNGKPISLATMRADPLRCGNYADIRDRAARSIADQSPQYARKTLSWQDMAFVEYEVLMLPFMPESGVQRILHPVSVQTRVKR